MEVEADDTLPFLDVLVMKRGPKLAMKVYRKPTHTGHTGICISDFGEGGGWCKMLQFTLAII
jgi:hypothetical protein